MTLDNCKAVWLVGGPVGLPNSWRCGTAVGRPGRENRYSRPGPGVPPPSSQMAVVCRGQVVETRAGQGAVGVGRDVVGRGGAGRGGAEWRWDAWVAKTAVLGGMGVPWVTKW